MKNILLLSNLNPCKYGSIEEHALFVARELKRRNIRCFLGFTQLPEGHLKELYNEAGAILVKVYCGDTSVIGNYHTFNLRESLLFTRFLLSHRIDLIHLNFVGLGNPTFLGMYLTPAKILFTEHASGVQTGGNHLGKQIANIGKSLMLKRVSGYVGVSEYVSRRICETMPISKNRIFTIYNGVNVDRFQSISKSDARASLDISSEDKVIGAVAMLIPEKGLQILIEAVGRLVKKGMKNLKVLIVGEGGYKKQLEDLTDKLDLKSNIQFLGRRSDVEVIIAASDVFVAPSIWDEAFGLSIAEAMAGSRPVIASAVGGIPELIDDNVNGILVPPGDSIELEKAISQIVNDSGVVITIGRGAREKVVKKFNLKTQVCELVDLYEKIIN